MKTAYDIVIRPLITEQSMEDLDIKKYAFEVAKDANKIEISQGCRGDLRRHRHQGHHPERQRQGQAHRRYTPWVRLPAWKKAVVKLSADSKNIELFEGMV